MCILKEVGDGYLCEEGNLGHCPPHKKICYVVVSFKNS